MLNLILETNMQDSPTQGGKKTERRGSERRMQRDKEEM